MTDKFKLTFNKPAVRQFLDGDDNGLRIKVENGIVMFKTAASADGPDATSLDQRTRGGIEATVEGVRAGEILDVLTNENGPFYVLKRREQGWVSAHPYSGNDAPPKFEPHVRVWTSREKAQVAPAKKKRGKVSAKSGKTKAPVSVTIPGPDSPYLDQVRAAYALLAEASRPGRPSNEATQSRMQAREIVSHFETVATELMGQSGGGRIDMSSLIQARELIDAFINSMAPAETPASAAPAQAAPARRTRTAKDTEDTRTSLSRLGMQDHDAPRRKQTVAAVH